jgi:hypothetical protein
MREDLRDDSAPVLVRIVVVTLFVRDGRDLRDKGAVGRGRGGGGMGQVWRVRPLALDVGIVLSSVRGTGLRSGNTHVGVTEAVGIREAISISVSVIVIAMVVVGEGMVAVVVGVVVMIIHIVIIPMAVVVADELVYRLRCFIASVFIRRS